MLQKYLSGHHVTKIKTGKSGADVYDIDESYILKHVLRRKLKEEQFCMYTREVVFRNFLL